MRSESQYRKRRREVAADLFVQSAEAVIAQKGYEGATMHDIAGAAGCAVGTLYLYFKNKEMLFNAMVTRHSHAIADQLARASAGVSGPLEQLRVRNEAMIAYFNAHREFFRIFYAADIGGRANIASNLRGSAMRAYLESKALEIEMARKAQTAGLIRTDIPPEEMIEFLHGVMVTTLARWSTAASIPPQENQKRLIWSLISGGLGVMRRGA
ncbi:MAG: TetR/AcrR family transcriptional regulator [Planctomycetota bacterium]|nr:TetR/AcrR family transcriptional regulator [Planctomycetota bacterium]